MAADDHDEALRAAMFLYLDGLLPRNGGQVWHQDLSAFAFRGQRIPLLQHMRGIRPDYIVQIRHDVLAEQDGPTLQHALQGLHGGAIALPRRAAAHPDPDLLEERFDRFLMAG